MQFDGSSARNCVQLGEMPSSKGQRTRSTKKQLERMQTKAAFFAALAATGCRSAYELEQKVGPNTPRADESRWVWSVGRDHVWDCWRRGTSTIAHMLRQQKPACIQRLAAVRAVSPLLDEVIGMRFWRCLDPAPLTTIELEPPSEQVYRYMGHRAFAPFGLRSSLASLANHQLEGLASPKTRYDAMTGLWLRLRSSCAVDALGQYALHYLCWERARPWIEGDPIFGPIADELYEYTQEQFGCVALSPATRATLDVTALSLENFHFERRIQPVDATH